MIKYFLVFLFALQNISFVLAQDAKGIPFKDLPLADKFAIIHDDLIPYGILLKVNDSPAVNVKQVERFLEVVDENWEELKPQFENFGKKYDASVKKDAENASKPVLIINLSSGFYYYSADCTIEFCMMRRINIFDKSKKTEFQKNNEIVDALQNMLTLAGNDWGKNINVTCSYPFNAGTSISELFGNWKELEPELKQAKIERITIQKPSKKAELKIKDGISLLGNKEKDSFQVDLPVIGKGINNEINRVIGNNTPDVLEKKKEGFLQQLTQLNNKKQFLSKEDQKKHRIKKLKIQIEIATIKDKLLIHDGKNRVNKGKILEIKQELWKMEDELEN